MQISKTKVVGAHARADAQGATREHGHYEGSRLNEAPDDVIVWWGDGRLEASTAEDFGWTPDISEPYVHTSNAIIERAVRHTREGTKTILSQAGVPPSLVE